MISVFFSFPASLKATNPFRLCMPGSFLIKAEILVPHAINGVIRLILFSYRNFPGFYRGCFAPAKEAEAK